MNRKDLALLEADRAEPVTVLGQEYNPFGDGREAAVLLDALLPGAPPSDFWAALPALGLWFRRQQYRCGGRWSLVRSTPGGRAARKTAEIAAARLVELDPWALTDAPKRRTTLRALLAFLVACATTDKAKRACYDLTRKARTVGDLAVEPCPEMWKVGTAERRRIRRQRMVALQAEISQIQAAASPEGSGAELEQEAGASA